MKNLIVSFIFILLSGSFVFSQVGVNTDGSLPDVSAGLDVKFSNKGLLIPQIALLGADDAITVPTPATSLLVYNTATAGTVPNNVLPGFYYNGGTPASPVWKRLATDPNFNTDPISQGSIIKLPSAFQRFGQDVPVGTILIDISTSKEYLALSPLLGTDNIFESQFFQKVKEISNATHTGGDVNGTNGSDVLTIADGAVTSNKILDGAIATSDLGANVVTFANMQEIDRNSLIGYGNGVAATANPQKVTLANGLTLSTTNVLSGPGGTVTNVSVVTANGVSGTVATATLTPAITLTLGDITPTKITSTGKVRGSSFESTVLTGTAPFVVASATPVSNLSIGGNAATATNAANSTYATNLKGGNAGKILWQSGTDETSFIGVGLKDQVLTSDGTNVPVWKDIEKLPVLTITTSGSMYTWDLSTGVNANLEMWEDTKIVLINPLDGSRGSLTVYNPGGFKLELDYGASGDVQYSSAIFPVDHRGTQEVSSSGPFDPLTIKYYDIYTWYFNGTKMFWDGVLRFTN